MAFKNFKEKFFFRNDLRHEPCHRVSSLYSVFRSLVWAFLFSWSGRPNGRPSTHSFVLFDSLGSTSFESPVLDLQHSRVSKQLYYGFQPSIDMEIRSCIKFGWLTNFLPGISCFPFLFVYRHYWGVWVSQLHQLIVFSRNVITQEWSRKLRPIFLAIS